MGNSTTFLRVAAWSAVVAFSTLDDAYAFTTSPDGARPYGGVAVSGTTIFGTAHGGGVHNDGTVWSFDTSRNTFAKLHDFDMIADGASPIGGVALSESLVFGTTAHGGAEFAGTIWSFDTSSDTFTNLHDFHNFDGRSPWGGVISTDGALLGTTNSGGASSGTIWAYDTTADTLTTLHEFRDGDGINPTGAVAYAEGTLYGTTSRFRRPENDRGTIWSFDVGANEFTKLHEFGEGDGEQVRGGVTLSGTTLLGTASEGGAHGVGTIWSFDIGTNIFTKLHDFRGLDGERPIGGVTASGTTIFGTTQTGGPSDQGTLWSFDINSDTFAKLHDFSRNADGAFPLGGVTYSDSRVLGTASGGGANGDGTIWSFDIVTNTFTKLHDFSKLNIAYRFKTLDIPGVSNVRPMDINNHGVVVGSYWNNTDPVRPIGFVWDSASFSSLDIPVFSIGVNDAGTMVTGGPCPDQPSESCAFLVEEGSYIPIESPGSQRIVASGINNANTIVGSFAVGDTVLGFKKSGDEFVSFEYPLDAEFVFGTSAHDVNDFDEIAGSAEIRSGADYVGAGFLLSGDEATEIQIGYPSTTPRGINNQGDIAGSYSQCFGGPDCQSHGFVIVDGVIATIDFPGALNTFIHGINDHGDLVGSYTDENGEQHAFVATIIPEPRGYLLASMAGIILLGLRTRTSRRRNRRVLGVSRFP